MKPIAILSCDTNPAYLSCLPFVCKSWQLQNFDVQVKIVPTMDNPKQVDAAVKYCPLNTHITIDHVDRLPSVNNALYVQCIRMYMPLTLPNDQYCILSDVDMMIGSSFLYRDFDKVNSFGHDLTGFGHTPICYIGMYAKKWREIMGNNSMQEDIDRYGHQYNHDWYKAWGSDQDVVTAKLQAYGFDKVNFINRGHDQKNDGLPMGRYDRHNWKKPQGEIHDIHLMRDPLNDTNFPKLYEMCNTVYPKEDWSWLNDYRNEFNKAV